GSNVGTGGTESFGVGARVAMVVPDQVASDVGDPPTIRAGGVSSELGGGSLTVLLMKSRSGRKRYQSTTRIASPRTAYTRLRFGEACSRMTISPRLSLLARGGRLPDRFERCRGKVDREAPAPDADRPVLIQV